MELMGLSINLWLSAVACSPYDIGPALQSIKRFLPLNVT